jgi:hypothetical protein
VLRADAQRLADAGDGMNAGNILDLPINVALVVAVVAWLHDRGRSRALRWKGCPAASPGAGAGRPS